MGSVGHAILLVMGLTAPLEKPSPSPGEIVENSPSAAWRRIPPEDLLLGTLAAGERVVIQLAPQFAPMHVANIRHLAALRWWNDAPVNRVQDNFVAQWGGATIKRPVPNGLRTGLPAEYSMPRKPGVNRFPTVGDGWSVNSGFVDGWPVGKRDGRVAIAHCYGTLGAGRDNPPDTGWGSELYVVIGQPPRQLDHNMAVVGRVIEGMEFLAGLQRGQGAAGELRADQTPARWKEIVRVTDLPVGERPAFEYLDTASAAFARYVSVRAKYRAPFYIEAPGVTDLCSVRVPVRAVRMDPRPNR